MTSWFGTSQSSPVSWSLQLTSKIGGSLTAVPLITCQTLPSRKSSNKTETSFFQNKNSQSMPPPPSDLKDNNRGSNCSIYFMYQHWRTPISTPHESSRRKVWVEKIIWIVNCNIQQVKIVLNTTRNLYLLDLITPLTSVYVSTFVRNRWHE